MGKNKDLSKANVILKDSSEGERAQLRRVGSGPYGQEGVEVAGPADPVNQTKFPGWELQLAKYGMGRG